MHCDILQHLYIRANGDVPCWDDFGERIILGNIGDKGVTAILEGERFGHIRSHLAAGKVPWPGVCDKCALLRRHATLSNTLSARRIHTLQVEPTLACNLRCPACSNGDQVRLRPRPLVLHPTIWERALTELKDFGYSIEEIEYCGQGEPLLHPKFPQLVEISRRVYPDALQRLITNGNFEYWKSTGGHAIDQIYVSCDGLYQASYEKYRVGGNVSKPLAFLGAAPSAVGSRRQQRVWKYILFEFNDSDEEILAAQEEAQRLGIDRLLFVVTHSAFKSKRFTDDTIECFPLRYPNVTTSSTPLLRRDWMSYSPLGSWVVDRRIAPSRFIASVDAVEVEDGGQLRIRGWSLSASALASVQVYWDGRGVGSAKVAIRRPDVARAHPDYDIKSPGFQFVEKVQDTHAGVHTVTLEFKYETGTSEIVEIAAFNERCDSIHGAVARVPDWVSTYRGEVAAFSMLRHAMVADGVAAVPLYRLSAVGGGERLWTTDVTELASLTSTGWLHEGVEGYVFPQPVSWAMSPLVRLFNPDDGRHLFTVDAVEADTLTVANGWSNEGVVGFVSAK